MINNSNNCRKLRCLFVLILAFSFSFAHSQPVQGLSFKVSQNEQQIHFTWQCPDKIQADHFILEYSEDGTSFDMIAVVRATAKNIYSYDLTVVKGLHYYRLKLADEEGKLTYSEILLFSTGPKKSITVFPNPSNGKFTLAHPLASGREQVQVLDMHGLTVYQAPLTKASVQTILDLTTFKKGNYQLVWLGEFEKLSLKILIQ